jgi:hypothetical protein
MLGMVVVRRCPVTDEAPHQQAHAAFPEQAHRRLPVRGRVLVAIAAVGLLPVAG